MQYMPTHSMLGREASSKRDAVLYTHLRGDKVRCDLCHRRCVIPEGDRGVCGTRQNEGGTLYTLVYGNLSALESRPIEIKPFFHYWPGSTALTFSTWSCNFDCVWCQNHNLSKTAPQPAKSSSYSPEKIMEMAVRGGDDGLCSSFQEPTVLTEWNLQTFRLASERELYCCYVSNGYMTDEALHMLARAGQRVEKRRLSRVGISSQSDRGFHLSMIQPLPQYNQPHCFAKSA